MLRQLIVGAWLLIAVGASCSAQLILNGEFDNDLSSWSATGSVVGSGGVAVLTESGVTQSLLYQPLVTAGGGAFTLSFDFRNALSSTVPPGALLDTFFATLYFGSSPAAIDIPGGSFTQSLGLFDLDATGAFNVIGTIGASTKGVDWLHFKLTFTTSFAVIVPAFDLRELNATDNDSAVAIDNVALNTAPHIATQPQSQGVAEGADVTFSVVVNSERPVTFQWRYNNQSLTGATADTLLLPDVRMRDAGRYTVAVSDAFGTSVSQPALLAVLRISGVEKTSTGATVRFPTVNGVTYSLEGNPQLGPTGWSAVGANVAGTGEEASLNDPGATGLQRFYRLIALGGHGTPSGYLQITVARNKTWPAANPFVPPASDAGNITALTAGSIEDSAAPWSVNEWSGTPHLIRITTGASTGRFFRITGNTATQLTLEAPGEDLTTLLVVGDRYEIAPIDTFASLLGTAVTPFKTGTVIGRADAIRVFNGRKFDIFFHDGTGWKSTKRPPRGQPRADANGTLLYPDEGFTILRRDKVPLTFTFSGQVTTHTERTSIGAKGKFIVAQRFPAPLLLGSSNFQTLPDWKKGDAVQVWDPTKRRFFTYTHNGAQWRVGRKIADTVQIPPATTVTIIRRTRTGAAGVVAQQPPFTLSP
jgi:hypothetical protein